jgi:hypothetical protein
MCADLQQVMNVDSGCSSAGGDAVLTDVLVSVERLEPDDTPPMAISSAGRGASI